MRRSKRTSKYGTSYGTQGTSQRLSCTVSHSHVSLKNRVTVTLAGLALTLRVTVQYSTVQTKLESFKVRRGGPLHVR